MQYFRYSFRSDAEFSTVEDEMKFVASYMNIQAIRYPNRIVYTSDIAEDVKMKKIPRFIIENFAENTVKYALRSNKETNIVIRAAAVDDRIQVSIEDDGCGMDEDTLTAIQSGRVVEDSAGRHTGIWNSRRRLDFYYQDQYDLQITSSLGIGTKVFLSFPASIPLKPPEMNSGETY